ncbi:putative 6-phosphofructokinase [Mycobacterium triplex]|uniref:Putative 6-phosphofructokinase n=1 Tax=Mycobacterium triplex TaxID=47839 RepID=A0A024K2J9_9MYCO|nr:putative 6-phosphofructokinase [Mycobacterium triplex]
MCVGNDLSSGISFYAHFSRVAPDPAVWEGVLCLHLANGDILVSRSFASSRTRDLADAGAISFRCVEPCQTWRLRFDGMARRVTTKRLAVGLHTDGPVEPLRMDITARAVLPPWSAGSIVGQDFGHMHTEQAMQLDGAVTIAGLTTNFSARGFRDHSRGFRDHSKLAREGWSFGFTPSGKVYFGVRIWQDDGPGFTAGMLFDGKTIHDVSAMEVPPVTSPSGDPREVQISLGGDFGTVTVSGQVTAATPFTLLHPIGQALGVDVDDPAATMLVEGPLVFEWDDERGYGWLERLARIRDLPR